MSLENEMLTALQTLCDGRVYPDTQRKGAAYPFIVWQ